MDHCNPILAKSSSNFNVVIGPHVHTNGRRGLLFFSPQFWAILYFSNLYTGHISRTNNKHLLLLVIIVVSTKSLPNRLREGRISEYLAAVVVWKHRVSIITGVRAVFFFFAVCFNNYVLRVRTFKPLLSTALSGAAPCAPRSAFDSAIPA